MIMVAPNGARRTRADHPALPVTIAETVATAKACFAEGAEAIHAHVRDADGGHVLDAGLYRELIAEMRDAVPEMAVQITTEAVGRYTSQEQRNLVRDVEPKAVSVALREMLPDESQAKPAREFYHRTSEAGIALQHIVYEAKEVTQLFQRVGQGIVPATDLQILFVLGRYAVGQQSQVSDLDPFLAAMHEQAYEGGRIDWGLCAFGSNETDCLLEAIHRGGKARIGFENSLWNRDGSLAADNAERVRELKGLLG
jgi:uncharacterized protein (DUF849 family)